MNKIKYFSIATGFKSLLPFTWCAIREVFYLYRVSASESVKNYNLLPQFIHSFFNGHIGSFRFGNIRNKILLKICMYYFGWIYVFTSTKYIFRSRITGACFMSIFVFLFFWRWCLTIFQNQYINFILLSSLYKSSNWTMCSLTHDMGHNYIISTDFFPWSLAFPVLHVVISDIAASYICVFALISVCISLPKFNGAKALIILFLKILLTC